MTPRITTIGVLVLLTASSTASQPQASTGPLRTEVRELTLPGVGVIRVTAGWLSVPENRRNPASRQIEIAFLRLPARAGASGPPLMYLAGGPGDAGITENPQALASFAPLLDVGDVVLIDQRGTGRSRPNLAYRWTGESPPDLFKSADAATAFLDRVTHAAVEHFTRQGVDLAGYNTEESADDIDALRGALGADQMNLLGFSYGTHLALSVIRRHGARVSNAVLVGVEGPDHTYKLPATSDVQWHKLALLAAQDSAIRREIPDLVALLDRVLARLEASPVVVTINDARSGGKLPIPVGADGLRALLLRDIGDASDLPVFPRLLHSIDRGDLSLLTWFVQRRYQLGAHLMNAAMDQASGVSPTRAAHIAAEARTSRFRNAMNLGPTIRQGVRDLGDAYRAPLVSPVRALFLSGTLDWNTPPFQAEQVRWGMPNSSHIVVRNAGHEQVMTHPAVRRAIVRFLSGENVDGTSAEWPPLRFVPLTGYDPTRTHPSVPRPPS